MENTKLEKPSKKVVRSVVVQDCKKIHEYQRQNPLLQRLQVVKILIEKGEIRNLNPITYSSYYKEIYGKCERNAQLKHESAVLEQYVKDNGLENKPAILTEAIEILQQQGKVRSHIKPRGVLRFYQYGIGNNSDKGTGGHGKKREKRVIIPKKVPEKMTKKTAHNIISDYERYNFEGRIMSLEVKLAYKIVNNSTNV